MTSRALLALLPPAAVAGYAIWKWPSLAAAGRGVSTADAITALALNSVAGAAIQAAFLVGLYMAAPGRLAVGRPELGPVPVLILSVAVLAVAGAVAWTLASVRGQVLRRRAFARLTVVRATLGDRRRALLLFGGSAAGPLLQAAAIVAVLHAIGRPRPTLDVFVAYLAASAAAALLPSPGSVGSLDITLGITLAGVGADPQTAVTAVVGYRLLVTWLPLLPSALALAYLRAPARARPPPALPAI
ncbi:lysylphosphatidylglycerol synthase domain-containing protein [Actinomycetes bacterium KLBMP 9797]